MPVDCFEERRAHRGVPVHPKEHTAPRRPIVVGRQCRGEEGGVADVDVKGRAGPVTDVDRGGTAGEGFAPRVGPNVTHAPVPRAERLGGAVKVHAEELGQCRVQQAAFDLGGAPLERRYGHCARAVLRLMKPDCDTPPSPN